MTEVKTNINNVNSKRKQTFIYLLHKLNEEFQYWGEITTFHGVPIIFRTRPISLKLFWLILFLTSFSFMIYFASRNIDEFNQHDVITKIRAVQKQTLQFPQVNVCNQNGFITPAASQYIRDYFRLNYNRTVQTFDDILALYSDASNFYEEFSWLQYETSMPRFNETLAKSFGYSFEMFFLK